MAVDLPTTCKDTIELDSFLRGREILSGDVAADKPHGLRGINSLINHGYGYRVHTIAGYSHVDSHNTSFFSTGVGPVDCTEEVVIKLGADVAKVRVVADVSNARVVLCTSDAAGPAQSGTTAARGWVTATLTLNDQTGQVLRAKLQLEQRVGTPARIYRYIIQEVVLTAGEIP